MKDNRIGLEIIELLNLKVSLNNRVDTTWGSKTAKGLSLSIKSIINDVEGEKDSYQFEELSEDAKQYALDKWRDSGLGYEWWDCVFDDFKNVGKIIGIEIDNIYFSGFSSQGDGACFEGEYMYNKGSVKEIKAYAPMKWKNKETGETHRSKENETLYNIALGLSKLQRKYFYQLSARVVQRGHYSHSLCTNIDTYDAEHYDLPGLTEDDSQALKELLRNFMDYMYTVLEKEYDYLTSEEIARESIEANEYEFDAEGVLI